MEKITFISRCLARIAFGALLTPCLALAQSPGSGTITGRIFNPIRGEYVRDAQINIANTGQAATSADGGLYRLINVPPGPVTVVVNYAGFNSATATVNSVAGQVTTLEFELTSAGGQSADAGTPLKLDKFVVSTEREGNAKAIMSQRTSMNITNSVASDVFGDIPDGNVATFIKNLPGVDIETASTVDRTPRLRGLPADYTQVTIDGINLASADANASTAANGRAFSFEQVSLNSMESIEINKTVSADQEANAPAGTIELKSKHAFDRKGRRITLLAGVSAHSEGFYLGKRTYGPDDSEKRPRILPSGILEYSDVFLNQRLGVVLNLSYANVYSPNSSSTTTYNFTPTAADPRPVVVTAVAVSRAQRANESFSSTLTTDFKATENLVFSFVMLFNYKDNEIKNYGGTFNAGARNTVVGATPVLSLTTSEAGGAGRSVANINNTTSKFSESYSYLPRFVYKRGDLTIEGRFALSIARSDYKPLGKHHKIQAALYDNLTGVNFRAERSSPLSADWQITQISGPDWADLSNYRNPRAVNDTHKSSTDLMTGDVTASYPTNRWIPIVWKTGVKLRRADYTFWNKNASDTWRYNGPGGGPTGSWGAFPSGYATNLGMLGARITSLSGRGLTSPDNIKIGTLFEEHPEYFTNIATPADYYTGLIANDKIYRETVGAAFLMGTATIGKLEVRAGVRWEDTTTLSTEFDPFPASKVVAAGFPVAAGRATTVPGLNYQYFTNPRRKRPGGYDYFFPSASAKYSLTKNLSAHLGYSRTIRRPTFNDVTGVFMIDEDNRTVSAPNTSLKPELSDNLSARFAYYFEPIGILGINFFENHISGLRTTNQFTAAEFGYGNDPQFSGYTFISGISSPGVQWIRGMEFEYSQSLSFLPKPFSGFNIRASYTRNYAETIHALLTPQMANAGFSYRFRRTDFNVAFRWTDNTPFNITGTQYRRHWGVVDIGGAYRISDRLSFVFTAKNILDAPVIYMEKSGANAPLGRQYDRIGTLWNFGIKGAY